MSPDSSDTNDDFLMELADEFVARSQRGESPDMSDYCQRHPDLADDIRALFPTLMILEGAKEAPNQTEGPALKRVGNYQLLKQIGRRGMGIVYEAEHDTLGRRVAVKILPQRLAMDQRSLARFHREARAVAKLHHSNIVPLYESGVDEDQRYIAMQLISGRSLDQALDD